jgi:hypothetical protein
MAIRNPHQAPSVKIKIILHKNHLFTLYNVFLLPLHPVHLNGKNRCVKGKNGKSIVELTLQIDGENFNYRRQ